MSSYTINEDDKVTRIRQGEKNTLTRIRQGDKKTGQLPKGQKETKQQNMTTRIEKTTQQKEGNKRTRHTTRIKKIKLSFSLSLS